MSGQLYKHNEEEPDSATQRLVGKYQKWTAVIQHATLTSPPAIRAMIIVMIISAGATLGMLPLHPPWYMYVTWSITVVAGLWRLSLIAEIECRVRKNAIKPGGAEKNAAAN